MAAVYELLPGDEVTLPGIDGYRSGVFVEKVIHPLWPHLMLVIWLLDDGSWSHDALDLHQDIGRVTPSDLTSRRQRLREALMGKRS